MSDVVPVDSSVLDRITHGVLHIREQLSRAAVDADVVGPVELHEAYKSARYAVDKLESALVVALRIQHRAASNCEIARAELEEAEIDALPSMGKEYASGREKSVTLNMQTLEQRRALRKAEQAKRDADHLVEMVRLMHRGADATRRDYEVRIRAMTVTTALDR